MITKFIPPEWAFEFHAHECPFMPIGYRMGKLALEYLGIEKELDHGFFVFPELGEGHPQTCMMDGMQIATGATYGKVMIAKTFYGKLAATFYHLKKGAVRYSLLPDFIDAMASSNFSSTARRASSLPKFRWMCGERSSNGFTTNRMRLFSRWRQSLISPIPRSKVPSIRPSAASAASTSSTATCA